MWVQWNILKENRKREKKSDFTSSIFYASVTKCMFEYSWAYWSTFSYIVPRNIEMSAFCFIIKELDGAQLLALTAPKIDIWKTQEKSFIPELRLCFLVLLKGLTVPFKNNILQVMQTSERSTLCITN